MMYQNNMYPQNVSVPTIADDYSKPSVGYGGFTILKEGEKDRSSLPIPLPNGDIVEQPKRRRGRPRKDSVDTNEIIKAEPEVESTAYTYQETTEMLRGAIGQIDELSLQIRQELEMVRSSRTLRRKDDLIIGLSNNLGQLINTKITAIREINSSISRSNDLDYKRSKDVQAAQQSASDDKLVMDLYNNLIHSGNMGPGPQIGGPVQPGMLLDSSIIRSDGTVEGPEPFVPDTGYLNYLANMTPEQNMMRYENNPNVKQVVVYDKATGRRAFQVMDMSTGQVIPNVPVRSEMFLQDTTIDLEHKIAKNNNLKETYPLVVINDDITNEY